MRPHIIGLAIVAGSIIYSASQEETTLYELDRKEALILIQEEIREEEKEVVLKPLAPSKGQVPRFVGDPASIAYATAIYQYAKALEKHGIPPAITIAQGMLESDNGRSRLARRANNHFGVKVHTGWKGGHILADDDAPNEQFCKFTSLEQNFSYRKVFLSRGRYAPLYARKFNREHFNKYRVISRDRDFDKKLSALERNWHKPRLRWAFGLDIVGYATDNTYATKLIAKMDRHKLYLADSDHTP